MKSKKTILTTLLLVVIVCFTATAKETGQRQNIRVGFFQFDGYHQVDKNGVPSSGYGYDLLQMIRMHTNWNFQYVGYQEGWPAMLPMLERGEIDLVSSVTKTAERQEKFDFSEHPVGYSGVVMTVKAGNSHYKIRDYANWNGIRIGMIQNNSKNAVFSTFAKAKNFVYHEIPFSGEEELSRALQEGHIDAAVSGSLRRLDHEWIYEELDFKPFYIAVKKGNNQLLKEINAAIRRMEIEQPGFAHVLQDKYYINNRETNTAIYFSAAEQSFLRNSEQENRVFSVLVNPDRFPFSSFENGNLSGVMADILTLAEQRTGLHFSVLPVKDREDYFQQIQRGTADLVLDIRYDFANAEQFKYLLTDSYLSASISILKRKKFSGSPKKLGVVLHSNMEYVVRKSAPPDALLIPYPSFAAMIDAVTNGECDGGYAFTRTAENIILNDRSGSLTLISDGHLVNFAIGVNEKNDPILHSVMRKAVQSISQEEIRRILLAHNTSGLYRQTFREFLQENSLTTFAIFSLLVMLLAGALTFTILSTRRAKRAHTAMKIARKQAVENAEWLQKTLISIGDAVMTTDAAGRITLLNPVAERLTGWSSNEAKGHPHEEILNIISYVDGTVVESPIRKVLATGQIMTLSNHTDLIARDGTRYHISDSAAPILNPDGGISGVILVFRDVTNEYNMRDRLKEALAGMEYAAELSNTAFFNMKVKDRSLVSCSKEFSSLWPVRDGKVIPVQDFVVPEDIAENQKLYEELLAGKQKIIQMIFRAVNQGQIKNYQIRALADFTDQENPTFFGVIQDITELTRKERQLADTLNLWNMVLDAIPIMIFAKDVADDYRYLISNRCFERFVGRCHEAIIGKTDAELFPDADTFKHFRKWDEAIIAKGTSEEFSESPLDSEGHQMYLRTTKIPYVSAAGRRLLLGVAVDLTRETESRNELEKVRIQLEDTLAQHEFLLNNMPVYVYAEDVNNDFRHVYCNELCSGLFGKPVAELIGKNDLELFGDSEEVQDFRKADTDAISDERLHESVMPFTGADGQKHIGRFYRQCLRLSGNRKWMFGLAVDITESEELAANQKVLNACLETFFQVEDPKDAIRLVLKNIAEYMGANYVYILKIDLKNALVDVVMEYGEPLILNRLNKYPIDIFEKSIKVLRDGDDCFLSDLHDPAQREILKSWTSYIERFDMRSIYFSGIRLDGGLWGDLGVIYTGKPRQITGQAKQFMRAAARLLEMLLDKQRTAERLKTALEGAQAADKAKSMFLASMSHEIRTPLNAVIGFSELLLDGTLPENERKDYLTGISSAGNALLALINDVLDLSKLEAGQVVLSPTMVDFSDLLMEVCTIFKQKCAERQIYLHTEIPPDFPDVKIDKLRIRQILFNLIGNAVKFTDCGGITVKVRFDVEEKNIGTLSFHVMDTGCGIAPEEQKNLFQMFVQAHSSGARLRQDGTGLGLAICHRLIGQMNGTVTLDSEPGRGSDFSVTLRNIPFEPHRMRDVETKQSSPIVSVGILLVDDVPMNLKVMSAMLKKVGNEPLTASSGCEALEIMGKNPVDLVLTDLWMPGMNGAELARKIRGDARFKKIRIAAVTADTGSGESFDMSIFDAILTKPVTTEKLHALLAGNTIVKMKEK